MTEDEFLERWVGHIARLDVTLEELKALSARSIEQLDLLRRSHEDMRRSHEDMRRSQDEMRVELRQVSLRGQRVAEQFAAEVRLSREERVKERDKDREALSEIRAVLRDLREESRAGRDALFVILDELRGRGGPAVAGA